MRANVCVNTCTSYLSPGRSRTDAEISAASGHSFSTNSRGPHRDLLKPRKDFFTGKRRKQEKSDITDSQLTHKINASRSNKLNHKVGTKTGQNMEIYESLRRKTTEQMLSIMDKTSHLLIYYRGTRAYYHSDLFNPTAIKNTSRNRSCSSL